MCYESRQCLKDKEFQFRGTDINLYQYLKKKYGEYEIAQQMTRAGTSIRALVKEAEFGEVAKIFFIN
jgi:four helix bundle protein